MSDINELIARGLCAPARDMWANMDVTAMLRDISRMTGIPKSWERPTAMETMWNRSVTVDAARGFDFSGLAMLGARPTFIFNDDCNEKETNRMTAKKAKVEPKPKTAMEKRLTKELAEVKAECQRLISENRSVGYRCDTAERANRELIDTKRQLTAEVANLRGQIQGMNAILDRALPKGGIE